MQINKSNEEMGKRSARENINPFIIRGESEFAAAFGIKDPYKQAELRKQGMPFLHDGYCYVYDPLEVLAWMKVAWKIKIPTITK